MRLIDADVLREEVYSWGMNDYEPSDFTDAIDDAPTVDVQPVIPAKWFMRGGKFRCSNCDALSPLTKSWEDGCKTYTYTKTKFCSECGAKMFEPQGNEVEDENER